jgi:hypothetical protein
MTAPPELAGWILATHPDPHGTHRRRPRRAGTVRAVRAVVEEIARRDARDGVTPEPHKVATTMACLYLIDPDASQRSALRDAYRRAYAAQSKLPF